MFTKFHGEKSSRQNRDASRRYSASSSRLIARFPLVPHTERIANTLVLDLNGLCDILKISALISSIVTIVRNALSKTKIRKALPPPTERLSRVVRGIHLHTL